MKKLRTLKEKLNNDDYSHQVVDIIVKICVPCQDFY